MSEQTQDNNVIALALPKADVKLRPRENGGDFDIYDVIRRKWVKLTPEEWVRQHFVHFLLKYRGYSPMAMANEVGIRLNGTLRRCDTLIYNNAGRPAMIIEYKASSIEITQRTLDQILRYNLVLGARYLAVSNGLRHYCCEMDPKTKKVRFLHDVPKYEDVRNAVL